MLYNRLLLCFFLFLTMFSTHASVGLAIDQQVASAHMPVESVDPKKPASNAQAEGPAAFLKALQDIDPEALFAMLDNLKNMDLIGKKKRENEQRTAHFMALPEDIGQRVSSANHAYEKLAQSLRVENVLAELCKDLELAMTQINFERESDKVGVLSGLGALKLTLKNGLFKKMSFPEQLPGGPQAQLLKGLQETFFGKGEEEHFGRADCINFFNKIDDLSQRLEGLSEAISRIPEDKSNDMHKVLAEKAEKLVVILNASKQRNSKALTAECINLIEPEFQLVIKQLTETISVLVDTRIQLASDADQKLKNALDYWLRNFKAYRKTLTSFLSLAAKLDIDLSFVLYHFSQIYDIASIFLGINKTDYCFEHRHVLDPRSVVPGRIDTVIRAVLATAVCLHSAGEIANRGVEGRQGIEGYLLGEESLEKFTNPFDTWESVLPVMITSVVAAQYRPTMYADRMHQVTRAICRIAGACFWHGFSESKMIFPGNPGTALNSYQGLRIAVRETIGEAQRFLDNYLEGIICDNVDQVLLEKIEKFSMGLVKPELINLSLEIVVPMIFLNAKFVEFKNNDFFPYELGSSWYWLLAANKIPNRDDLNAKSAETVSRFYAEYRLIHYACTNLGRFLGSTLTRELHIPVLSMLMKAAKITGSGLVSVADLFYPDDVSLPDLIDEQLTVDENIFDDNFSIFDLLELAANGEMRHLISVVTTEKGRIWLKKQLVLFFQEKTQVRMIGIEVLKGLGFLKAGIDDPLEVNYRLISTLLYYLTCFHVFSHSQNADLLEFYLQDRRNTEPFIDRLIEEIKGSVAGWVGGWVGDKVGGVVANKIIWDYRAPALNII